MTGNIFNRHKLKSILLVLFSLVLAFSLLFAVACGTTEEEESGTSYSRTENDTEIISNGTFEYRTLSVAADSYPYSSSISWTNAVDSSSRSSSVNSGIIDTAEWDTLLETLVDDNDFKAWAYYELKEAGLLSSSVKGYNEITVNDVKNFFVNPGTRTGALPYSANYTSGTKILMINNYTSASYTDVHRIGTAQKFTNSSSVSVKAGTFGKLSVWVKTAHMHSLNSGATIRLQNTIGDYTQENFAIVNISDTGWTQYTIYVKGNDSYDGALQIALGLGVGNNGNNKDYAEGTVYFDDVVFEEIEEADYNAGIRNAIVKQASFVTAADNNPINVSADELTNKVCGFDMNIDVESSAVVFSNGSVTGDFTSSNVPGLSGKFASDSTGSYTTDVDSLSISADKASYKVTVNNPAFNVAAESYARITFTLNTNMKNVDSDKGLTVILYDGLGNQKDYTTLFTNLNTKGEDKEYSILVKNEISAEDDIEEAASGRTFFLAFYLGPVNLTSSQSVNSFPTDATVALSNVTIVKGAIDGASSDANDLIYAFYNTEAETNATVSLSAGYTAPAQEDEDEYSFTESYSYSGTIKTAPSVARGYKGQYGVNDADYNVKADSGLINTKYLAAYEDTAIAAAIGDNEGQFLMIKKNAGERPYAFFEAQERSLTASGYVIISVKVLVSGTTKGYIALVDNDTDAPIVLKVNGTDHKFETSISDTNGDWVTVRFFLANGATALNYRLELWDSASSSADNTTGYVFFDEITFSSYFSGGESGVIDLALGNGIIRSSDIVSHARVLNEEEIAYNEAQENEADKIDTTPKPVWAKSQDGSFVFGVFNTVDPVHVHYDPNEESDGGSSDGTDTAGCGDLDAGAFWMSFSSILLAIALVAAIVVVIIKYVRRRIIRRKKAAVSRYDVSSRNAVNKAKAEKATKEAAKEVEEKAEEPVEEPSTEEPEEEYTYGEVFEDFEGEIPDETEVKEEGEVAEENAETNEEAPVEENEDPSDEEKK